MTILTHRLLAEQSRCRQLIGEYRLLGSAGAFGTALIQAALARADYANALVDEAAMRRSLDELQTFEEAKPQPLALRAGSARVTQHHAVPGRVRNPAMA